MKKLKQKFVTFLFNLLKGEIETLVSQQVKAEVEKQLKPENEVKAKKKKDPNLFTDERSGASARIEGAIIQDCRSIETSIPIPVLKGKPGYVYPGDFVHNHRSPLPVVLIGLEHNNIPQEYVEKFFALNLRSIFFNDHFTIQVTKPAAQNWDDILPQIMDIIFSMYPEKQNAPTSVQQ